MHGDVGSNHLRGSAVCAERSEETGKSYCEEMCPGVQCMETAWLPRVNTGRLDLGSNGVGRAFLAAAPPGAEVDTRVDTVATTR